jgi:hypothetical protein
MVVMTITSLFLEKERGKMATNIPSGSLGKASPDGGDKN